MSYQTVKKYLNTIEKSYLIYRVLPFFTNKKKEIIKQPKLYFVDTGMRNIVVKDFNINLDGKLFENYVFSELLKNGLTPKYWRTKSKTEVDFIIEKGNEIIPIEVKIQAEVGKIERSMHAFIDNYHPKNAFVLTLKGKKGKTKINNCNINYIDIKDLINFFK
jgi:hypothetical protein